ncbi:pseudouridine synthase [Aquabacterium sp.]|uniref:pseudouridine synthase n=1 Tax=Aquabacterium sp. TaxID=1872578 RepID=UPI002C7BF963|nr:pseudouridine synthase [Aquabacterium sp.]HSW09049.1 pseudouridine synthase [Aquabacterium sp.]
MSLKKKPQRIDEILFNQGFGTRRECAGLIEVGLVRVGGATVSDPGETFMADGLGIEVEGRPWVCHDLALVLLHKPAGYECSQKPSAWPSVMLLLPAALRRRGLQPVGRLDQDTTGLLLLTDDGGLIHRFTSPKKQVPKVYEISTDRPVDARQVEQLLFGVMLDDEPMPVRAEGCEITGTHALRLTLVQGKYHQVKRMVAAVGNHVTALHRSSFGKLVLPTDLAPGQWAWVEGPQAITG